MKHDDVIPSSQILHFDSTCTAFRSGCVSVFVTWNSSLDDLEIIRTVPYRRSPLGSAWRTEVGSSMFKRTQLGLITRRVNFQEDLLSIHLYSRYFTLTSPCLRRTLVLNIWSEKKIHLFLFSSMLRFDRRRIRLGCQSLGISRKSAMAFPWALCSSLFVFWLRSSM